MYRLTCFLVLLAIATAVDQSKFRTCSNTGFCNRNRNNFVPQHYELSPSSIKIDPTSSTVVADLVNGRHPLQDALECKISVLQNNVVRLSVREKNPKFERWEVPDVLQADALHKGAADLTITDNGARVVFGDRQLEIVSKPFSVTLSINGLQAVSVNSEGLLNFEQYRDQNPRPAGAETVPPPPLPPTEGSGEGEEQQQQPEQPEQEDKDLKFPYDVDGMWTESFGSHTDSKPRGPSAVAADITFIGSKQVYGIPEHATKFALKTTKGDGYGYDEPYRLYNLDVFEYALDVPMALYGTVPFMLGHDEQKTSAVLWLNSAETFIDVDDAGKRTWYETLTGSGSGQQQGKQTRWISESGVIDVFLMVDTNPAGIHYAYNSLTGFPALPQRFAIAYHQCRWNYKSEDDVAQVDGGFDKNDIPYDVLWLDIEHTDGKKYFTWDSSNFPTPKEMQQKLAAKGRKMVTIVDPHIKRDSGYSVHKDAEAKGLYVKNNGDNDFEGWCWPGSVSYLDFCRPEVRDYWASLFAFDKYQGSTPHLYIWNDMNEPSVFNGPEVTMPKDNLHVGGKAEHRDVHNMYGFYHQWATEMGLVQRDQARPFVLTRSFFAGSQQYGAVWTGDNEAKWEHLEAASPMLLSLNVAGITFSGADVGGFFGNPDAELMTRWYQAGAFQPFFRGHAHIDATRREPWLFGEPHTTHIREAIRARYAYLPYIYTIFQEATVTGIPVMRPLWLEFPKDVQTFDKEQESLLGDSILVHPVSKPGQTSTAVYLPGPSLWYDVHDFTRYTGGASYNIDTPITKMPVFQRGGKIVAKRERARRSSRAMENDPFTLVIALDEKGEAEGRLYYDDGHTFNYKNGEYYISKFTFSGTTLTCTSEGPYATPATVERVVIIGLNNKPDRATSTAGQNTNKCVVLDHGSSVVIRKPDLPVNTNWKIDLMFTV